MGLVLFLYTPFSNTVKWVICKDNLVPCVDFAKLDFGIIKKKIDIFLCIDGRGWVGIELRIEQNQS
jgi:hypothetical protein